MTKIAGDKNQRSILQELLRVEEGKRPDDWQRELVARVAELEADRKPDTEWGRRAAELLRRFARQMRGDDPE